MDKEIVLSPNDSDWKLLFSKFLNKYNLNILLLSHFDLTELSPKISDLYKEVHHAWKQLIHTESLCDSLKKEYMWYNKNIKIGKKYFRFQNVSKRNMVRI